MYQGQDFISVGLILRPPDLKLQTAEGIIHRVDEIRKVILVKRCYSSEWVQKAGNVSRGMVQSALGVCVCLLFLPPILVLFSRGDLGGLRGVQDMPFVA